MQMSGISFNLLHAKRWKRETFLHATKETGDVCTQVTLKWPWWVTQLHLSIIHLLGISQLLRNKHFTESFLIIRLYHIIFCLSFLKTFVINLPTKMCNLPELATCNTFVLKINLFY